jgi:hypothetical protein
MAEAAYAVSAPRRLNKQLAPLSRQCFIDATFVMVKGGGSEIGATKRGKGMKIMAIVDRHGLPLSVSTHAANHHEVRLVQLCFDFYMIEAKPENLIGDRAYDSDPLDAELRKDGAASGQPKQAAYARSAKVKPLHAPLARRAFLRLDSMAAPDPHSLGVPRPQFGLDLLQHAFNAKGAGLHRCWSSRAQRLSCREQPGRRSRPCGLRVALASGSRGTRA